MEFQFEGNAGPSKIQKKEPPRIGDDAQSGIFRQGLFGYDLGLAGRLAEWLPGGKWGMEVPLQLSSMMFRYIAWVIASGSQFSAVFSFFLHSS